MITIEELQELEHGETGCTRLELRSLARLLNETGSDKAASKEVARIICALVRDTRTGLFEFLRNPENLLTKRQYSYEVDIRSKRVSRAALEPKLRDLQTSGMHWRTCGGWIWSTSSASTNAGRGCVAAS